MWLKIINYFLTDDAAYWKRCEAWASQSCQVSCRGCAWRSVLSILSQFYSIKCCKRGARTRLYTCPSTRRICRTCQILTYSMMCNTVQFIFLYRPVLKQTQFTEKNVHHTRFQDTQYGQTIEHVDLCILKLRV